jgi:aspartate racemase
MRPALGILGGMGGLASAEFVKTIYESNPKQIEQDAPLVILISDPTFPDRTQAILTGSHGEILDQVSRKIETLYGLGASRVALACVTLHYVLPMLTERLRRGIVSLIDVTLEAVRSSGRKHLLLCTTGARTARLFENHPLWPEVSRMIVYTEGRDQELVHSLLYQYKTGGDQQPLLPHLARLLDGYGIDSFIAGCTELHMLTKAIVRQGLEIPFIDPLMIIARNLDTYLQTEGGADASA